jgi:ABC-2 type transport system permease protein
MLGLLLKNRLRIIFLGFTRDEPRKRLGRVIGATAGLTIFFLILFYSIKLISFINNNLSIELADTIFKIVLDYGFAIIFIFILFSGIATTLYILYWSKDLELLLSLPISIRTVFTYKYLEALATNSYIFFIIIFPFLISYGITSDIQLVYYPVMLIILISTVSLPTSLGVLIGMVAARYINPARAREIIAIIGGLLGLVIWLSSQILSRYMEKLVPGLKSTGMENTSQQITAIFERPFLRNLPSTWGSNVIFYIHNGYYGKATINFILIAAVSGLLVFICIALSQKIYYTGWSGAKEVSRGMKIKREKTGTRTVISKRQEISLFSGINYLIIKEFKILSRDMRRIIQIFMPVVMFIFIFFWSFSSGINSLESNFFIDIEKLVFLLVPLLISGFANINISGNNIGGEGLKFWIIKMSPVSAKIILRTKIIFSSCITASIGIIIMILFYFLYNPGILTLSAGLVFIILFSWGDSLIVTSVGTFFPVFKPYQSNKNSFSFPGGILIMLFFVIYIAFFGSTAAGLLFLADFLGWPEFVAFIMIMVLGFLVNIFLYILLINVSALKLNSLEWKY